jgi:hypothetical protein
MRLPWDGQSIILIRCENMVNLLRSNHAMTLMQYTTLV